MTGTINYMAQQAKTDEMLRQAAEARRARREAEPKQSRSRGRRILGFARRRLASA
jgi:hypothetical protein